MKKAILLAGLCISLNAQVFTIDDFEAAPFTQTGSSTEFTTYSDASILGGFRQVRIGHHETPLETVNVGVADGVLTFNETEPSYLVMRYGSFADANDSTSLHLDMSDMATAEFTLDVASLTGPFDGSIDFYSYDEGGTGHYYDAVFFTITEPGQHTFDISEVIDTGWVDTSDVAGFEIGLAFGPGGNTGSYVINGMQMNLVPVPEPSTYAVIFSLGLVGFAVFRGWRKSLGNPTECARS